jgi:hypothetical protein
MGAFVGEKNLDVTKMHGTTIKKVKNNGKWVRNISVIYKVARKIFFT